MNAIVICLIRSFGPATKCLWIVRNLFPAPSVENWREQ